MTNLFKRPRQETVRLPVQSTVATQNAQRRQREDAEDRTGRSSTIMTRGLVASAGKLGR